MEGKKRAPHYHLKCGIAYILSASFCFTSLTLLARFATRQISVPVAIFFQHFIPLFTLLPWLLKHGVQFLQVKKKSLLFIRCFGATSFIFLFLAVQRIPLIDAILLNNASPILIPFILYLCFKVPINHKLWGGIICGFVGVLFILRPSFTTINLGAIFALLAAVANAVAVVTVRRLSYTERNHTILFYYFLAATLGSLPFAMATWVQPTIETWAYLVGIGVLSTLGQWSFVRAFHHAKPTQLSPFLYMGVVYSGFYDWILFDKIPTWIGFIGIGLVCIGGIWSTILTPSNTKSPHD